MKKIKIFIGLAFALLSANTYAQNGLESVVVEKYYVSDATDAAGSVGTLPTGSVTYRVWADLLPGYNFQVLYGVPEHELHIYTSTTFFNNEDYGSTAPTFSATNVRKNSALLDSWFSVGGAASGKVGVFKSEDTDGSPGNNTSPVILQNNDASATGAINIGNSTSLLAQDGMIAGTPVAVTFVGLTTELDVFDATSQVGGEFSTTNGSIAALGGATGPTTANRVLIGQFTTDGAFGFELNIQIGTPSGGVENYVASNPQGSEITIPSLTYTPNQPPTVSITSPASGTNVIAGSTVTFDATASDADGTVTQVEFFDGVNSIGVDNSSPYSIDWTSTTGMHNITAKATDDDGAVTTSAVVVINVAGNLAPTVSITAPSNGAVFTAPQVVTIGATAADGDGSVTQVEFFVNNASIGIDATSPYSIDWTSVIGPAALKAKATDNNGSITTSATVNITIADPNALPYSVVTTVVPCTPSSTCIPVSADAVVSDIIGYDVTMNYDVNKLTPSGVITKSSDLINATYYDVDHNIDAINGVIYISAFLNTSAPSGTTFNGTGDLFCVEFDETPSFTAEDSTSISVSFLQESYITGVIPQLVATGKYVSHVDSTFPGTLVFWADNSPIKYNSANPTQYLITNVRGSSEACTTLSGTAVQPDLSGNFDYEIENGLYVNIDRNVLGSTSVQPVVNGFDALLTRKLLINDPSFVPNVYQAIAMDVNLDGAISAGDVSQIRQRAVLINPEFHQAWNYNQNGTSNGQPSKDWLFIASSSVDNDPAYTISTTFPANDGVGFSKYLVPIVPFCLPVTATGGLTGCPDINPETFKGIMLGDVNGNYQNIAPDGLLRSNDKIVFDLSNSIQNGNVIDVPVMAVSSADVNALDFSMQFDESYLSYQGVINNDINLEAMSNLNQDDKTLRFTSNNFQNYDLTKPSAFVRFELLNGKVNPSQFKSVQGYINGEEVNAEVDGSLSTGISLTEFNDLVSVFPNPASNVLNIQTTQDATMQLCDVSGKQVVIESSLFGQQNKELNVGMLPSGIYMLKVYNNNFVTMKKIVIER